MSELPDNFFTIRMELAREKGHPEGSSLDGYELVIPLTPDGKIDADTWRENRSACSVLRFRSDEKRRDGWLARKPGGSWYFDYNTETDVDNESGFKFKDEAFVVGEYVSITEAREQHTYRITSVVPV